MENEQLEQILEAAIFAADEPLSPKQLLALFPEKDGLGLAEIKAALERLQTVYGKRGVALREVGSGYRFQAKEALTEWIKKLWQEKPPRYSRALLETLVLIAYRQPITRGEIEEVRGVAVSTNIIKTLLEHEWIKVVGHRDTPGKPSVYATTKKFLDYFNLKSLNDLPSLSKIQEMTSADSPLPEQVELLDMIDSEDERETSKSDC